MTARVDFADIQGDILRAHGNSYDRTSYVFVGVADEAAGRGWLSGLVSQVATAAWRGSAKPDSALNVAFTCTGLQKLGVPEHVIDTCSKEFRQGMAGRAKKLGDTGPSAPSEWDENLGTGSFRIICSRDQEGEGIEEAEALGIPIEVAVPSGPGEKPPA